MSIEWAIERRGKIVRAVALGLFVLGTSLGGGPRARADAGPGAAASASQQVEAEIVVLLATNVDGGGGIDPRIGPTLPLHEPPFSSYNTYKLLGRSSVSLKRGAAAKSLLPNGRSLELTLKDVTEGPRYRVATRISDGNGGAFLPLFEVTAGLGEPFFVAGQVYEQGVLFVGMTLVPTPAP